MGLPKNEYTIPVIRAIQANGGTATMNEIISNLDSTILLKHKLDNKYNFYTKIGRLVRNNYIKRKHYNKYTTQVYSLSPRSLRMIENGEV